MTNDELSALAVGPLAAGAIASFTLAILGGLVFAAMNLVRALWV